jgi:hypothetical protein
MKYKISRRKKKITPRFMPKFSLLSINSQTFYVTLFFTITLTYVLKQSLILANNLIKNT